MIIRTLMVILFIRHCLTLRVKPWKFFQLNADYFNEAKGIYSKLDIDKLIPIRWRLGQFMDTGVEQPETYPVFVKPEWGQNSAGIVRADSFDQLKTARSTRTESHIPYLIQASAEEKREFEVYIILSADNPDNLSMLSVTEVTNSSDDELPINSINNQQTRYNDVTDQFSVEQQQTLWQHLKTIGQFKTARYGIRANSPEELVAGDFHVFEINLFLPMPLILLCENVSRRKRWQLVRQVALQLAKVTGSIPATQQSRSIFFRKLFTRKIPKSIVQETGHRQPVITGQQEVAQ